jgi:hypothetical protein
MHISAVSCALIAVAGTTVLAQQGFIPAPGGVRLAERWRPADRLGITRVIGTVVDARQVPVAYAKVQLRNLLTSAVEQQSSADGNGAYEFAVDEPSTYVVEMVSLDGYVLALSNAGSVGRYETLQTAVQLSGRWDASNGRIVPLQDVSSYFGMSSRATMTASTLDLATNFNIPPVDPGEPVSP